MGIGVQPCCCDKHTIYRFSGGKKYKHKRTGAATIWTYAQVAGQAFSGTVGADVDHKNRHVYSSRKLGKILRYKDRDASGEITVATLAGPATSTNRLNEFRVYPDREFLLLSHYVELSTEGLAELWLQPFDGSLGSALFSFDNRFDNGGTLVAGQPTPISPALNVETDKIVFTQVAITGFASGSGTYTATLKQIDIDGSNEITLHTFSEAGFQVQTLVFGDIDYDHQKYFVTEGSGFKPSTGARQIYSFDWSGSSATALVDGNDVLPYFTGTALAAIEFLGFYDLQVADDGRVWFRAYQTISEAPGTESNMFSMEYDGSDLRHEWHDRSFFDDLIVGGDREGMVLGTGFNTRRGRG